MNIKKITVLILSCLFVTSVMAAKLPAKQEFDSKYPGHALYMPEGKGPFPVILLLHGSGGVKQAAYHDWARILKDHGYATYIIDSFDARGYKNRQAVGWEKATSDQLSDIAPAYAYVSKLPKIDGKRVGMLGFSLGGYDIMKAMQVSGAGVIPELEKIPFKAGASFYPVCKLLPKNAEYKGPLKIFMGTNDVRGTTEDCEKIVARESAKGKEIYITTYSGAMHGFDNEAFKVPVAEKDAQQNESYELKYDEQAHKKSIKDVIEFLDKYMK